MNKLTVLVLASAILAPQSFAFAETRTFESNHPIGVAIPQEREIGGIRIVATPVHSVSLDTGAIRVSRLETNTENDGTYRFTNLVPKSVYTLSFLNTAPFEKKEVTNDGTIIGKITKDMLVVPQLCTPNIKPFVKNNWDNERILQLRDLLKNQGTLSPRLETMQTPRLNDMKKDIVTFQKKYNIPATGFIGDVTTKKLNDIVSREQTAPRGNDTTNTSAVRAYHIMNPGAPDVVLPSCAPIAKPVVRPIVSSETANRTLLDTTCGSLGYNPYKMECNEPNKPELNQTNPNTINTPRVMFWQGKVNQHWNSELRRFETDVDGVSGATSDVLGYCKKIYPRTTDVESYKEEVSQTWAERGNKNNYMHSVISILCLPLE
jgi:Amyloid A4 N-terminal heparin-binding